MIQRTGVCCGCLPYSGTCPVPLFRRRRTRRPPDLISSMALAWVMSRVLSPLISMIWSPTWVSGKEMKSSTERENVFYFFLGAVWTQAPEIMIFQTKSCFWHSGSRLDKGPVLFQETERERESWPRQAAAIKKSRQQKKHITIKGKWNNDIMFFSGRRRSFFESFPKRRERMWQHVAGGRPDLLENL